jgi:hypothetical protein
MSIIGETVLQFRYSNLAARTAPSEVDYKVTERRLVAQGQFETIVEAYDRLKLLMRKDGYAVIYADGVLASPADVIADEAKFVAGDFKVIANYSLRKRLPAGVDDIVLGDLIDITDRCLTPVRNNFIVTSIVAEQAANGFIITVS